MNKNTGKRGRIPLFSIKLLNFCYISQLLRRIICYFPKNTYLCNVFFIVLDLRLTKVGARRCSFFLPKNEVIPSGTSLRHPFSATQSTRDYADKKRSHIFSKTQKPATFAKTADDALFFSETPPPTLERYIYLNYYCITDTV